MSASFLCRTHILCPSLILFRHLFTAGMDPMGSAFSRSPLECLHFDNVALKKLPVDPSKDSGVRTVKGACFAHVQQQPLVNPKFVAVSEPALALIGLSADDVLRDPLGPEYLSGSTLMPGSEPAAHCYCGHQFGNFAGQLGDGAASYLGEVKAPADQSVDLLNENPCGRWEIQVKGAGLTPFSRQADGRKVLRSSIREFLCSEAMFALGVPTTRAGSLVTSDLRVTRDIFYDGRPRQERCSVVLRIAPSFIRFGSFEIFKPMDELTGRQGPSVGRNDIRAQLLDYVIETFYPEIQQNHADRAERNAAFFREVTVRTAKMVALWQCVGFVHGVLNTDNMSIVGVTLDYGPFGFMDRFDPDFVSNNSDNSGRYSYQAQPAVCRFNLARLAEALGPELRPQSRQAVLDEYLPLYNGFYLGNMRKKLGLLRKEEPEDETLVTDLLQTMHNTGADFTNTFRSLSQLSCPLGEETQEEEEAALGCSVDLLLEQCSSLKQLKEANKPTMDHRELAMVLSLAQSNPALFEMLADKASVSKQLERLARLKELVDTNPEDLKAKQREDWTRWVKQYRKRLAQECDGQSDPQEVEEERVRTMDSVNPRVVLRNYIAQNVIEAAEAGDYSEVQRILKVLEKPFSAQPGLEHPGGGAEGRVKNEGGAEEGAGPAPASRHPSVAYHSKPPMWASEICVS